MALFGKKTASVEETKTDAAADTKTAAPKAGVRTASKTDRNLARVLKKPRTSEKAYYATEKNVYVFEVAMDATKHDVRDAIRAKYGVTPRKINVTKQSARSFLSRQKGKTVTKSGVKKAYIYLKDGDKIDLV